MTICVAKRFDGRRCGNLTRYNDPERCHIHSLSFPQKKCIATETRTGKRCKKKPIAYSFYCMGHKTTP